MTDARVPNAKAARAAIDAAARSIVVTGDEPSRLYWAAEFAHAGDEVGRHPRAAVISEHGRKGNFLGALQAYERAQRHEFSPGGASDFDQLVMLVGSGTRLSPITQSLRNMKAALILPSNDGVRSELTVGEAAIRSSAPWVRVLEDGGFTGVVLRWGDEILIPSSVLSATPGQYAEVDAVRFGYRVAPTELLASQKEWLVSDGQGIVQAELPRQSLGQLTRRISTIAAAETVHVNLGSFAASHRLLDALTDAFGDLLRADDTAANWDPYLWMALHSDNADDWEQECCAHAGSRPPDFASLVGRIPDFWERAQGARRNLELSTGRSLAIKVLDFGDPYWFDAGNHASLQSGISDIFAAGSSGDTIRALLGLPDGLAHGDSLVASSDIASGVVVRNSLVIGSEVSSAESTVERAVIVNSRFRTLTVAPGGVVIECDCADLAVDGPSGFAFRLSGSAHVRGDEVVADVGLPPRSTRLSYFDPSRIVDDAAYGMRLWQNPVSFKEAAAMVEQLDPLEIAARFALTHRGK
jgi:hypothetical protein